MPLRREDLWNVRYTSKLQFADPENSNGAQKNCKIYKHFIKTEGAVCQGYVKDC